MRFQRIMSNSLEEHLQRQKYYQDLISIKSWIKHSTNLATY